MRNNLRSVTAAVGAALIVMSTAAPAAAHDSDSYRERFRNGCTLSPDQVPRLINLQDLCNQHDVWYARYRDNHHQFGTNEWGRYLADYYFLQAMNRRCTATYAWWDPRRGACYTAASVYFGAVRYYGAPFYYDYNWVW